MAESDWAVLANALDTATVARGVTSGVVPPTGGGSMSYGMRSKATAQGLVGLYCTITDFNPLASGGEIAGAIMRANAQDLAAFLFLAAGGNDVSDNAYQLGLSNNDPAHLVLRKGSMLIGLPDDSPGSSGVLARSTETFDEDTWVHVKLEHVVNPSGDVFLNVYKNSVASVTAPSWVKVPGMSDVSGGVQYTAFIDDVLGANSGSAPYTAGRAGFATRFDDVSRTAYFDHIELARQT